MLQAPAFRGLYVILLFHSSQAQYQWGASSSTQNKLLTQTNDERVVGTITSGTSTTNCTCVESYRCLSQDIITDGSGTFNLRRYCTLGQVCCTYPQPVTTAAPTTASPSSSTLPPYTYTDCGVPSPDAIKSAPINIKITATATGSQVTSFGEFPWMAAILDKDTGGFICGGSLVSVRVVLTAAHCVQGRAPGSLMVRLGEWDASATTEALPTQETGVSSVVIHPQYYPPGVFYDLALLQLDASADITKNNIGLECIPDSRGESYVVDQCVVTGWGKETFGASGISAILKKIQVPLVDHLVCQSQLQNQKLGSRFRLHESFLCAGGQVGKDACTGDGGGPLMCPLGSDPNRMVQVGVVSWGLECGLAVPGVYADLTRPEAGTWLRENINSLSPARSFNLPRVSNVKTVSASAWGR